MLMDSSLSYMLREGLSKNKGEFNGRRGIAVNLKVVFG